MRRARPGPPMRILLLTHRPPFPPDKGDKIRSFHLLEHLSRRHELHLATLVDDPADLAQLPQLATRVRSLAHARIDGPLRRPLASLALLAGRSASVEYFHSGDLQRQVDALLGAVEVDCVFAYSSPMAEYVLRSRHASGRLARALKVIDYVDVDSAKWADYARRDGGWRALAWRAESRALAAHERRVAAGFDRLLLVSAREAEVFPDAAARSRIVALQNGVDLAYFAPGAAPQAGTAHGDAGDAPRVVFTGVMDYRPNVEGVAWFASEVWPLVRAGLPDAQFDVVGSRPARRITELAREPGINVTGRVDDVRGYLARARVSVAPLRIARGVQNKVLEAMAMAKPVVATPEAADGIEAEPGRDLVVAGDAQAFAASVLALLRDGSRAESIGRAARACVERHYRWDRNLAILDGVLG
jgi:sugar transferase (PEP-CTERM/EpsH1 system associated)